MARYYLPFWGDVRLTSPSAALRTVHVWKWVRVGRRGRLFGELPMLLINDHVNVL